MTDLSTQNIELLHVTAYHYAKGQRADHLPLKSDKFHFWASGDTFFDDPRPFMEYLPEQDTWIPKVNLTRFECRATANNVMTVSLLEMEIEARWATDSVAHDLPIFMQAFKRNCGAAGFAVNFAMFTLIYQVEQYPYGDGEDWYTAYTCLGELDYSRIADICIVPDSRRSNVPD